MQYTVLLMIKHFVLNLEIRLIEMKVNAALTL